MARSLSRAERDELDDKRSYASLFYFNETSVNGVNGPTLKPLGYAPKLEKREQDQMPNNKNDGVFNKSNEKVKRKDQEEMIETSIHENKRGTPEGQESMEIDHNDFNEEQVINNPDINDRIEKEVKCLEQSFGPRMKTDESIQNAPGKAHRYMQGASNLFNNYVNTYTYQTMLYQGRISCLSYNIYPQTLISANPAGWIYTSDSPNSASHNRDQSRSTTGAACLYDVKGTGSAPRPNYQRNTKDFKRIEECKPKLEQLSNLKNNVKGAKIHSLLTIPFSGNQFPKPYPSDAKMLKDIWDDNHVKMPYSKRNMNDWKLIKSVLKSGFKSPQHLENSIKKYNKSYSNTDFTVLREFFNNYNWKKFESTVNNLAKFAAKLPYIVTKSVPLLKQREHSILFISQYQIGCLLANAFFCTFPRRSRINPEYKNFPPINFFTLFTIEKSRSELKVKIEKLKCIFNYFIKILEKEPDGIVTFERRNYHSLSPIFWELSNVPISGLEIREGTIESEGKGYTEVDFANKYIGGGVLTSGCVQEELRFLMCPELIISRLFTEMLLDSETMVMTGCMQYNMIKGYAHNFEYVKHPVNNNNLKRDDWGRYYTQIVAMDAAEFHIKNDPNQFEPKAVLRALNKAYCGFHDTNTYVTEINPAIASGKWGCGAFNGDPYLVCLLQLMAASQVSRNLILFIQNDMNIQKEVNDFYQFALKKNLTIMDIYKSIASYNRLSRQSKPKNIFDFIMKSN